MKLFNVVEDLNLNLKEYYIGWWTVDNNLEQPNCENVIKVFRNEKTNSIAMILKSSPVSNYLNTAFIPKDEKEFALLENLNKAEFYFPIFFVNDIDEGKAKILDDCFIDIDECINYAKNILSHENIDKIAGLGE